MSLHHMLRAAAGNTAGPSDPYFEYNTLLLTGDGTNGAQNNTFLDSSTNNFTITRNGNTTQGSFSPYGNLWSNYFDGSGDYLGLGGQSAFSFGTGDWTIETWVYFNDVSASSNIYESRATTEANRPTIYVASGTIRFFNGTIDAITSSTVSTGQWYHIAVSKASGSTRMFINGTQSGSTYSDSLNYGIGAGRPLIGAYNSSTGYLNGYLSNLRVVNGTAVYTSNFTPSTTPLTAVSGTSLLTCQSNRFIDNSSNNFAITVAGNTSVQRFSPFNPTAPYSTSTIGGSGYFDGSGDYLSTSSIGALSGDFTIEFWAYKSANGSNNYDAVFAAQSGGTPAWFLELSASRGFYLTNWAATTVCQNNTTSGINDNQWHHWAVCRSGSNWYMFKDGVSLSLTTNNVGTGSLGAGTSFLIGAETNAGNTYTFNGYMSNARIVNGTALYTTAFTPPTAPLTAITNTSLLCNMTNAGIPDAAMMNDLETVGNAQVSTSVKKYGTGSLAFDGTGDGLFEPASLNATFGTGDYTVECWLQLAGSSTQFYPQIINFSTANTNAAFPLGMFFGDVGLSYNLIVKINGTENTVSGYPQSSFLNTWRHIAISRSGTSTKVFVDGVLAATYTDTGNYSGIYRIRSGYLINESGTFYLNGYIDDLRITKGYARYTTNFTPPTAALPLY